MSSVSTIAIPYSALRVELPAVPDWFRRDLSKVATRNGQPVFRLVDGQRELKFRNGKMDVKHLLQHPDLPCYIPVAVTVFRRKNTETGEYKKYSTRQAATGDTDPALAPDIEFTQLVSAKAVGRSCWIVEVLIAPEEIGMAAWDESRYQWLRVHGVETKVDVLGPFPRDGMYVYCFSVLDDHGNAISPGERTLEECRKRWSFIQEETRTAEQNTELHEGGLAEFERKQVSRIADNFYQLHGIAARRLHYGAVSKPITKVKTA